MDGPKRQVPRVQCDARFRGGGASENLAGVVTDLSATGLFLHTRKVIPVGEQVHLQFELPTGEVDAVGEVRWASTGPTVRERGLGIRFLRLTAESARAIDEAVGELEAQQTVTPADEPGVEGDPEP